jgi:hypothetical protein
MFLFIAAQEKKCCCLLAFQSLQLIQYSEKAKAIPV